MQLLRPVIREMQNENYTEIALGIKVKGMKEPGADKAEVHIEPLNSSKESTKMLNKATAEKRGIILGC